MILGYTYVYSIGLLLGDSYVLWITSIHILTTPVASVIKDAM